MVAGCAGFNAAAGTTSGIAVTAGAARPGPGVMDLAFAGCLAGTTFGATVTGVAAAAAVPAWVLVKELVLSYHKRGL